MSVTGPFNVAGVSDTPTRQQIFVCRPATEREEAPCARQIVETLATRAYRHPVDREQLSTLMDFYADGRAQGGFEARHRDGAAPHPRRARVRVPLRARAPTTSSPARSTASATSSSRRGCRSSSGAASRTTSCSGSPSNDKLHEPARCASRCGACSTTRGRTRSSRISPASGCTCAISKTKGGAVEQFPDFDDNLRQAFRTETELLFASIVREDRSLLDLLTADYTFVNERLARHYGMPGIYGSQFRRVPVTNDARRGMLGQGSILLVTSYPERTSPVQRGMWVLENIVGAPVPTPPPNVPALEEQAGTKNHPRTLREQMELHTTRPFCAGCHKIMDPIGFALENFDAIGRWRTEEHGEPIDATAQLVDGTRSTAPSTCATRC